MNITMKDIDWKSLLIKKYQKYGLNEMDCMVLFVTDAVLDLQPKVLVTSDVLLPYMKASREDIDSSLSRLITSKTIELVTKDNQLYTSIDSFKERMFLDEIKDISVRGKISSSEEMRAEDLYTYLEDLGGQLSPIERDRVSSWLKTGADESMIKEACQKSLTRSGHISFSTADRIVVQMIRSESRKTIGVSAIDENDRSSNGLRELIDSSDWSTNG